MKRISQPGRCRHCGRVMTLKPRSLCHRCYYTPRVREMYPSISKFACRGVKDTQGLPAQSTTALPGSPEKVAVLAERAEKGQSLWHPGDNRNGAHWRPLIKDHYQSRKDRRKAS